MSRTIRNPATAGVAAVMFAGLLLRLFFPGSGKTGQELAIYEIKQAGGRVEFDEGAPGKPVVRVDLEGVKKTGFMTFAPLGDDGLAQLRPHLESLPRLRYVRITSTAMISDAGLKHLEGLTQLETMELYANWLSGSRITESGVERLRKQLPTVRIHYFDSGPPRNLGMPPRP
jgi:hypothetical protein